MRRTTVLQPRDARHRAPAPPRSEVARDLLRRGAREIVTIGLLVLALTAFLRVLVLPLVAHPVLLLLMVGGGVGGWVAGGVIDRVWVWWACGVNPPRTQSPTWGMVVDVLRERQATVDADPGSPLAARTRVSARPDWLPAPAGHADAHDAAEAPAGWAELAALGPITPPTACSTREGVCTGPAIAWTTMRVGPPVARCANHPPGPDEWGHRLDWTPKHPCRHPGACWCPRCPRRHMTPAGATVIDRNAIASGKRRSNLREYREAQTAKET